MKIFKKMMLALILLNQHGRAATDTKVSEQPKQNSIPPSSFKLLRFSHTPGGNTGNQKFNLTGSMGQHNTQTSSGGQWQLIAGLITPQQGWLNDLIYIDTFESQTSIDITERNHE